MLVSTSSTKKSHHMRVVSYAFFGTMRAIAWETAAQAALRSCPEEAGGQLSIHMILVKGV